MTNSKTCFVTFRVVRLAVWVFFFLGIVLCVQKKRHKKREHILFPKRYIISKRYKKNSAQYGAFVKQLIFLKRFFSFTDQFFQLFQFIDIFGAANKIRSQFKGSVPHKEVVKVLGLRDAWAELASQGVFVVA